MGNVIDRAAKVCGGLTKLAASIGQTPQTVCNWRSRVTPVRYCLAIERATGGKVTRRDLRPDDWQEFWPDIQPKQPRASKRATT